jgi:predicted ATPase/DNA-binding SARP family transcriptional activator
LAAEVLGLDRIYSAGVYSAYVGYNFFGFAGELDMLEVRLLGQFEARLDDRPLDLPSRPAQSLLAYLVLTANIAHRRERLAGMFWPEATETNARAYLRQTLWRLRKAVEAGGHALLAADDLSIAFVPTSDFWLDTAVLERDGDLAASVAVYRGDLLPGFYDEWVALERERLRAIFDRKLGSLLEKLTAARNWREILDWGERWIGLGSAPEAAYRALMVAHAELDDPAGAVAIFQRCVETLRAELGVSPAAETLAVYEKVKASAERPLVSLPFHPIPLVGREQELDALAALLDDPACRLLTLMGPGGAGKTRLALAAAHARASSFPNGAWFISLAPLNSVELLIPTIASGIGLTLFGPAEPKTQLFGYLRDKKALIVLDSFEHLLSGAITLAELLATTAGIKLVVTSRERLLLQGEWLVEVSGLKFPMRDVPAAEAASYSAVQLFLQSARRVRAGFALDETDSLAVTRICRLVAGLPLGIELAASWVWTFSCAEIAAELGRNLSFLNTTLRDVPERHRSMQAVFDHSWRLLPADEQRAFAAQSVFRGGFTRQAAEQITAASPIQLSALVDKSLLRRGASGRFEMHELLRQFGRVQLMAAGQAEAVSTQHAAYYLQLAQQAERELHGPRQTEWLARLEADHDNLRAALAWSLERGPNDLAAQLCGALWRFWYLRGYLVEGRGWLKQVLAPEKLLSDAGRAKALCGAANLAWFQGDFAAARALAGGSVAMWRRLGDQHSLGQALAILGMAQGYQGDQALAHSLLEESLAIFRQTGDDWGLALALFYYADPRAAGIHDIALAQWVLGESLTLFEKTGDPWGMALPLHGLGEWLYEQEEFAVARAQLEAALALRRKVGDNWLVAQTLGALGDVARCQNDYAGAQALYSEGLGLYQAMGSEGRSAAVLHHLGYVALNFHDGARAARHFAEGLALFQALADKRGMTACIEGLAGVMGANGRSLRAAQLLGAAEALRAANGVALLHADRADHERAVAAALLALTLETFEAAWAKGKGMTLEQAAAYASAE